VGYINGWVRAREKKKKKKNKCGMIITPPVPVIGKGAGALEPLLDVDKSQGRFTVAGRGRCSLLNGNEEFVARRWAGGI